jgi:hypothetical protein
VFSVKVAVIDLAASIVTVQVPVPEQPLLLQHVLEHLHRAPVFVERNMLIRRMVQRRITYRVLRKYLHSNRRFFLAFWPIQFRNLCKEQ